MYSFPWCCTNIIVMNKTYKRHNTWNVISQPSYFKMLDRATHQTWASLRAGAFLDSPRPALLAQRTPLVGTGIDLGFPIRSTFLNSYPNSSPICWVRVPHPCIPCVWAQNWVCFGFQSIKSFWKLPRKWTDNSEYRWSRWGRVFIAVNT